MDTAEELDPPSASRVARRALNLAVITCRGFIDADHERAGDYWARVTAWHSALGLKDELEPWEVDFLQTPLGRLAPQQRIDASWLCEGLVVLAWALNRFSLPAYDTEAQASDVTDSLGFLDSAAQTLLAAPTLRPHEELLWYAEAVFSIHWRLVEATVRPRAIDFVEVARTASFGPLSLDLAAILESDLAIRGTPIAQADPQSVRSCRAISQERHRAASWLIGAGDPYSEAPIDT